jgi:hypothetical protein
MPESLRRYRCFRFIANIGQQRTSARSSSDVSQRFGQALNTMSLIYRLLRALLVSLAISLLLAGCASWPPQTDAGGAEASSPPRLRPGMSYAQTAAELADSGWLPLEDRVACIRDMGERGAACRRFPELQSCDREDACTLRYAHIGSADTISLTVPLMQSDAGLEFGELRAWKRTSIAWHDTAAASCPAHDFDGFLRVFANDDSVRAAYTAPLIKVGRLIDLGDAGYVKRVVLVLGSDYRYFALHFSNGNFYLQDTAGGIAAVAAKLEVIAEPGGAYLARVPGVSETVAYRFFTHAGCWRLSEAPEYPSP